MLNVKHRCMNVGQQPEEGGSERESEVGQSLEVEWASSCRQTIGVELLM